MNHPPFGPFVLTIAVVLLAVSLTLQGWTETPLSAGHFILSAMGARGVSGDEATDAAFEGTESTPAQPASNPAIATFPTDPIKRVKSLIYFLAPYRRSPGFYNAKQRLLLTFARERTKHDDTIRHHYET